MNTVLSWLHVGDLHITEPEAANHRALRHIVALINGLPAGSLDFAVLPGDNADDGTPEQFTLVRDAVAPLRLPLHILPGDHDFKPRALDAFHRSLGAAKLPHAMTLKGVRCLFLDVVSPGGGGPDFRLDDRQLEWAEQEVEQAERVAVFMHTYPADLRAGTQRLNALLARPNVLCVDMGHTHYNELANDGGTIFMATRSTGQIEEGPAGFSIAAIDRGCVSWRFKPLEAAWPCVLITSPADRRLATAASHAGSVRAKVIGDVPVTAVETCVGPGAWTAMASVDGDPTLWQAGMQDGAIRVRAVDAKGRRDEDVIEPAPAGWTPAERIADGSDRNRIGAWPEKDIPGSQLGPNRNGRKW